MATAAGTQNEPPRHTATNGTSSHRQTRATHTTPNPAAHLGTAGRYPPSGPKMVCASPPPHTHTVQHTRQQQHTRLTRTHTQTHTQAAKAAAKAVVADLLRAVDHHARATVAANRAQQRRKPPRRTAIRHVDPLLTAPEVAAEARNSTSLEGLSRRRVRVAAYTPLLRVATTSHIIVGGAIVPASSAAARHAISNAMSTVLPAHRVVAINALRANALLPNPPPPTQTQTTIPNALYIVPETTVPLRKTSLWALAGLYTLPDWNWTTESVNQNHNHNQQQNITNTHNVVGSQYFQAFYAATSRRKSTPRITQGPIARAALRARVASITASYQGEIDRRTREVETKIKELRAQLSRWVCSQIILRDNEINAVKTGSQLSHLATNVNFSSSTKIIEPNEVSSITNDSGPVPIAENPPQMTSISPGDADTNTDNEEDNNNNNNDDYNIDGDNDDEDECGSVKFSLACGGDGNSGSGLNSSLDNSKRNNDGVTVSCRPVDEQYFNMTAALAVMSQSHTGVINNTMNEVHNDDNTQTQHGNVISSATIEQDTRLDKTSATSQQNQQQQNHLSGGGSLSQRTPSEVTIGAEFRDEEVRLDKSPISVSHISYSTDGDHSAYSLAQRAAANRKADKMQVTELIALSSSSSSSSVSKSSQTSSWSAVASGNVMTTTDSTPILCTSNKVRKSSFCGLHRTDYHSLAIALGSNARITGCVGLSPTPRLHSSGTTTILDDSQENNLLTRICAEADEMFSDCD